MALRLRGGFANDVSQLRAIYAALRLSLQPGQPTFLGVLGTHKRSGDLHFSDATGSQQEGAFEGSARGGGGKSGADGRVVKSGSEGGALGGSNDSPERAPVKPPEKDKGNSSSFSTPLDLVKKRMLDSGLQAAGPLPKGAPEEEATNVSGPGVSASGVGGNKDTSSSDATTSEGGAQKGSIQYLDVHKEKVAELKALEELTFDDGEMSEAVNFSSKHAGDQGLAFVEVVNCSVGQCFMICSMHLSEPYLLHHLDKVVMISICLSN